MTPLVFESLRFWSEAWTGRRIYSPVSYRAVRQAQIVAISASEAAHQAHWYPVAWQQDARGEMSLVAVRSLLGDGRGNGDFDGWSLNSLSHLLFAFPFTKASNPDADNRIDLAIDAVTCDARTDAGSPVLDRRGSLTPGAKMRLARLDSFHAGADLSTRITQVLVEEEALEPWPIEMQVAGQTLALPGLHVVKPPLFDTPWASRLIARFGPEAAMLLAAHRVSLFRVNWLRMAARRDLSRSGADDRLQMGALEQLLGAS